MTPQNYDPSKIMTASGESKISVSCTLEDFSDNFVLFQKQMQVGPWSQTRDVPRIQMRIQSLKPVGRTIFTVYIEAIPLEKNTIVAGVNLNDVSR